MRKRLFIASAVPDATRFRGLGVTRSRGDEGNERRDTARLRNRETASSGLLFAELLRKEK